ncbi:MAG: MaoC family dehydratase N-terminal domain-containing protein [Proteobacteria bacterium]|nr:MaoC family dehydratase N-terminal domain-containing protein [Pseudomonadota bacterium]
MEKSKITDAAFEEMRSRVGTQLRVNYQFNSVATEDAIKKFADGIGDPNILWQDENYAASTSYKTIPAPPSWLNSVLPTWVLQGLPGVHALQTSVDWQYNKPVLANDRISPQCFLTGCKKVNSKLYGKSVFEQQEVKYINQDGHLVASVNSSAFRVERRLEEKDVYRKNIKLPHPWKLHELEEIEDHVLAENYRGAKPLYFEDVQKGEALSDIIKGPLGITDIISFCIGASPVPLQAHGSALRTYRKHPAWAFRDSKTSAMEPVFSVHYNIEAANECGLPYPYDTAVQRHCWLIHFLTNWMGDKGWIKRSHARFKGLVYLSDAIRISGYVTDKYIDDNKECCVDIVSKAINQRGDDVMPAKSTIILPSRNDKLGPIDKRINDRER